MKIYVFGYRGMLGRYVYTYLKLKGHDVVGISRDVIDAEAFNEMQLRSALFQKGFKKNDVIINCIGTIKPQVDKLGALTTIKVNSLFPHFLANVSEKDGYKMIQITTDCVFSGNNGQYNEKSPHDCTDVYGKTKSLGEPSNCTVVRSSIIGEEVGQTRSLIEWIKSMKDKPANGFTNHHWNGVTCLQMAKVFEFIIVNNIYWSGVRHVFSPEIVSKYELVKMVSDAHNLNVQVNPIEAVTSCNRSLSTIYNDIDFNIPPLKEQIEEQYNYFNRI
jgi:dTDP-4-dehydrorhamnose reductase